MLRIKYHKLLESYADFLSVNREWTSLFSGERDLKGELFKSNFRKFIEELKGKKFWNTTGCVKAPERTSQLVGGRNV